MDFWRDQIGMQFIDLKKQYQVLQSSIDARIRQVLEHGQFIMGPEVSELEQQLADYVGTKHCISVASGTMSLEIALRSLQIGPGDEVITVPFTWISCAETISLVGATPVFVDIEPDTFNLDIAAVKRAITPKTKAILAVNLFGHPAHLTELRALADAHGIKLVEDNAQSVLTKERGRYSGTIGHM